MTSRVWFTLSHGILDEIYYPHVDWACTRDLGLIVTDGCAFFSEEKRHARHQITCLAAGVPAYRLINTCQQGRYRIEKEVITDPWQEAVVLQRIRFTPLQGSLEAYHLYALLAPHLDNGGGGNTAWLGEYKGVPMLFAKREHTALALACSVPWRQCSVGFVGVSDGWQDLMQHKRMTWNYTRAENGNVALTGEVDLGASHGTFVLSLGFGTSPAEAGHRALASLLGDFDQFQEEYVREWQDWQQTLLALPAGSAHDLYRISTAVVCTHEAKSFLGGIIASLSIPWGFARGDNDLGGYHLVWPRDLVEAAGGLLAADGHDNAYRVLHYLHATQESDGHWPQNMWLDGRPYWHGIQMDETALPILLVDQARRAAALDTDEVKHLWPMVRRAVSYLVRNGPVTQEDRWEMDPGYSPFTLAAEIAALVVAADLAELAAEERMALYLRDTADNWNASIERWTYVTDTDLDRQLGITGHYVRIAPPEQAEAASPHQGFVPIKNRPPAQHLGKAAAIVGTEALALVRFGLRAPDDPRMVDTVQAIDALLKVETPYGPVWRRYPEDQYGEHADGSPFNGTGIGRGWPLLTGERAHYELAAGRRDVAEELLRAMETLANEGGMLPEQTWDAPDIHERGLCFGRPAGSGMPLVWAHAEYIKLRRSLHEGRVFDTPPQTVQRYLIEKMGSPYAVWRFNNKCSTMPAGKTLRLEVLTPALVQWSTDGWYTVHETPTWDTGLGMHVADVDTTALSPGGAVDFTFYWPEADRWEQMHFRVLME
jgi:glucoamylase